MQMEENSQIEPWEQSQGRVARYKLTATTEGVGTLGTWILSHW